MQSRLPNLTDDISLHAAHVYESTYKYPYKNNHTVTDDKLAALPRPLHGIQHAARVAVWASVFINLYKRSGDDNAKQLTEADIKLIQIAALYHDAARQGDGVDVWDKESGVMLYDYLISLGVDKDKAIMLAEAVANKDYAAYQGPENKYYSLQIDENGKKIWTVSKEPPARNIYQKIIHDADSLDISRIRKDFEPQYLDFYQDKVLNKDNESKPYNETALTELTATIREAQRLIEKQGESVYRERINPAIKKQYDNQESYSRITKDIATQDYPTLNHLMTHTHDNTKQNNLFPLNDPSLDKYSSQNLNAALIRGEVCARGVATPTGVTPKGYLASDLEMRKALRRRGKATRTKKSNNTEKHGNKNRSIAMMGWGAEVFTPVGYLIIMPHDNNTDISVVAETNINSGVGKKHLVHTKRNTPQENKQALSRLLTNLKLGKKSSNGKHNNSEILADLTEHGPAFFTLDYIAEFPLTHPNAAILQAVHLQKEREKHYTNNGQEPMYHPDSKPPEDASTVEIYEYSSKWLQLKKHTFSREKLVKMWNEITFSYLYKNDILSEMGVESFLNMPVEDIKIKSIYGDKVFTSVATKNESPDMYYDSKTRADISKDIETHRKILVMLRLSKLLKDLSTPDTESLELLQFDKLPQPQKDLILRWCDEDYNEFGNSPIINLIKTYKAQVRTFLESTKESKEMLLQNLVGKFKTAIENLEAEMLRTRNFTVIKNKFEKLLGQAKDSGLQEIIELTEKLRQPLINKMLTQMQDYEAIECFQFMASSPDAAHLFNSEPFRNKFINYVTSKLQLSYRSPLNHLCTLFIDNPVLLTLCLPIIDATLKSSQINLDEIFKNRDNAQLLVSSSRGGFSGMGKINETANIVSRIEKMLYDYIMLSPFLGIDVEEQNKFVIGYVKTLLSREYYLSANFFTVFNFIKDKEPFKEALKDINPKTEDEYHRALGDINLALELLRYSLKKEQKQVETSQPSKKGDASLPSLTEAGPGLFTKTRDTKSLTHLTQETNNEGSILDNNQNRGPK